MNYSIDSFEWWNSLDFVIKGCVNNISVCNLWLVLSFGLVGESVLHPVLIVSLLEVVSGVGTSGLLSVLSGENGHFSLNKKILELKSFYKISVPYITPIAYFNVGEHLRNFVDLLAALLKEILSPEDSGVSLHGLLQLASNLGGGVLALSESQLVEVSDSLLTSIWCEVWLGLSWLIVLGGGLGSSSSENDKIKE